MLSPGLKTKVWVKKGPELHAIPVELGTTNGTLTQVLSGLSEGDKVITEVVNGAAALEEANAPQTQNPFAPRPRNYKMVYDHVATEIIIKEKRT